MIETPAYLSALRERFGLSQLELAERCGLSKVAVWRACTEGWAVRGHTLDTILKDGFGLDPAAREYKKAVALWTRERLAGPKAGPKKSKVLERVAGMGRAELNKLERWLKEEEERRSGRTSG